VPGKQRNRKSEVVFHIDANGVYEEFADPAHLCPLHKEGYKFSNGATYPFSILYLQTAISSSFLPSGRVTNRMLPRLCLRIRGFVSILTNCSRHYGPKLAAQILAQVARLNGSVYQIKLPSKRFYNPAYLVTLLSVWCEPEIGIELD
jgi:hypothetical protein